MRNMLFTSALLVVSGCTFLYADEADKKQCKSDKDCQALDKELPLVCDTDKGVCVDLSASKDAGVDKAQVCTLDAQCPSGVCENNACADCRENSDCKGEEKLCLAKQNECVECLVDKDCSSGKKCGTDNTCFDPIWGCIPEGVDPASKPADWPTRAKAQFTFSLQVANLLEVLGIGNVSAYACEATSAQACDENFSFAKGTIDGSRLSVDFKGVGEQGFVGYVLINSSEALPGYFHFVDPIVENVAAQDRLLLISQGTVEGLGAMANIALDPGAAMLIVLVYDCEGQSVANVQMQVDKSPNQGFVAVKDEKQPVFNTPVTTKDGVGIIVNVTPGFRTVTLRNGENGPVLRELTANLRANAINYMHVYPSHAALMKAQERIAQGM